MNSIRVLRVSPDRFVWLCNPSSLPDIISIIIHIPNYRLHTLMSTFDPRPYYDVIAVKGLLEQCWFLITSLTMNPAVNSKYGLLLSWNITNKLRSPQESKTCTTQR